MKAALRDARAEARNKYGKLEKSMFNRNKCASFGWTRGRRVATNEGWADDEAAIMSRSRQVCNPCMLQNHV